MTTTQARSVTMKGKPLTLAGWQPAVGDKAPDFKLLTNDLAQTTLADFKGNALILSAVPSLDTGVCATETRRFNEEAQKLDPSIRVLTISMDLPFAQKRWCGAEGVERVVTLSDHRDASFGKAYGVLIPDLRLLARAVFVVDKAGVIRHAQIVPEIATEPDYESVLDAARNALTK